MGNLINSFIISGQAQVPWWSDCVLLLHMDTDFTDSSTDGIDSPHTVSVSGDAAADSGDSKFGVGSGLFDGTGDYLTIPDSAGWTFSGDFTVDFWMKTTSTATDYILQIGTEGGTEAQFTMRFVISDATANKISFKASDGASFILLTSTSDVNDGAWNHISTTKSGTSWDLRINAASEDSTTSSIIPSDDTQGVTISAAYNGSYVLEYSPRLDELRILNGYADIPTTVPTAPYSQYG